MLILIVSEIFKPIKVSSSSQCQWSAVEPPRGEFFVAVCRFEWTLRAGPAVPALLGCCWNTACCAHLWSCAKRLLQMTLLPATYILKAIVWYCNEFRGQAFLSKAAYLNALFLTAKLIFLSFYLNDLLARGDLWLASSIFSNEVEQHEVNVCVHGQGF